MADSTKTPSINGTESSPKIMTFPDGSRISIRVAPSRLLLGKYVMRPMFDNLLGMVIIVHMCYTIYETDQKAKDVKREVWQFITDLSFLTIYFVELTLKIYIWRLRFFRSWVSISEFSIVILDIGFTFFDYLPSIGFLRVLRLTRLMRSMRIMMHFRELYIMAHGMLAAAKAICWASVMLIVWLTVWSIVSVELINPLAKEMAKDGIWGENCGRCARAFSSVSQAALTYTQQIIAGDSWGYLTVPIIEHHPWTAFVFLSLLVTVNFGLLNLILTVIVDRAATAREEDVAMKIQERDEKYRKVQKQLLLICHRMDEDKSGQLTLQEIDDGYDNDVDFRQAMQLMDVGKEDIQMLFAILDGDGSGSVTYTEFIDQLHKMRTEDTHMMLTMIRFYINDVRTQILTMVQSSHERSQSVIMEHHEHVKALLNPSRTSFDTQTNAGKETDEADLEKDIEQAKFDELAPITTPISLTNLERSLDALKRHFDERLVAFADDLCGRIDASLAKQRMLAGQLPIIPMERSSCFGSPFRCSSLVKAKEANIESHQPWPPPPCNEGDLRAAPGRRDNPSVAASEIPGSRCVQ